MRRLVWPLILVLFFITIYVIRVHEEMVDFEVYRTAADRALDAEPLYRADDGHYQYKYFPAFALVMAPFAMVPDQVARAVWFALTCGLLVLFVRWSILAIPGRRKTTKAMIWAAILLMGKFYASELNLGQTNVLLAVMLMGAYLAAEQGRHGLSGVLVGLAVFVKPYALIFVPWLWFAAGWTGLAVACATALAGLALPALVYGWAGNIDQVRGWYSTVTQTTAPNLLNHDNASFASTWSKWLGVGPRAMRWAFVSSAVAMAIAALALIWRRQVERPGFLEFSVLLFLIPLISPQGWVYVLLLGTPATLLLVDRWGSVALGWRVLAAAGIGFMSFTIFDLLGRKLYMYVMSLNIIGIAAFVVFLAVINLRYKRLA
jgi:hypothetical protein